MAQARRMRLSVDPRDGGVRLILPPRASMKAALAWVESKRGWIEAALDALPKPQPIRPGMVITVAGEALRVEITAKGRITRRDGDVLLVPGPEEMIGPRVLRWLRAQALAIPVLAGAVARPAATYAIAGA